MPQDAFECHPGVLWKQLTIASELALGDDSAVGRIHGKMVVENISA